MLATVKTQLNTAISIVLRDYQTQLETDIYGGWGNGAHNVLAVLPTGGGKTVIFAKILNDHEGYSCAIAHRQELVLQISLSLARNGVRHRIVGSDSVVRMAVKLHMLEVGASFYDSNARCAVASVDTLVKRKKQLAAWSKLVTLWVTDEAHHVTKENKWGTGCSMFPNAKGLGVTATPIRADGKGLGRHASGLFDTMVVGPTFRELVRREYLCEYKIYAPPSDLQATQDMIGASGDYSPQKLKKASEKSKIVGDVVKEYLKQARGKLGVTFATDVETATKIAAEYCSAGIPASVVTAKTPDLERQAIIARFRRRELLQLVNVDLFGEGFDLPAIEVVSMARPTMSYALFAQQFGRALRLLEGKLFAIIIDHVGNVVKHCRAIEENGQIVIDVGRDDWTLDDRERRSSQPCDVIPLTTCVSPQCGRAYVASKPVCPHCGMRPLPMGRSSPELVAGDLIELDTVLLMKLKHEIDLVNRPAHEVKAEMAAKYMPQIGQIAHVGRHVEQQKAQLKLREAIGWFGAYQRAFKRCDSESYRIFFYKFGVDVLSAQALKTKDAEALTMKIYQELNNVKKAMA